MRKRITRFKEIKRKRVVLSIVVFTCTLIVAYLAISAYFMNRFYFGATINCTSISGKTVQEVDDQIASEVDTYVLEIIERGGQKEQIRAEDIALEYIPNGQIQDLKNKQNSFKWIAAVFNREDTTIEKTVSYNEELLKKYVDSLACLNNNIVEPQNASIKYTDTGYVVIDEVNGNKINKDILYDNVVKAILKGESTVDLETINCYENPKYTSNSKEVVDAKNTLNKYISSVITYNFGQRTEVLNGLTINNWLEVDGDFSITFSEEKVKSYLDALAKSYNTIGKTRELITSIGTSVKVSGGDYGWLINKNKEVQDLISVIKEGQAATKEPAYIQTALTRENNDLGKTYVEINMTKQHLWFYKNGSLIVEGDVVTGNVSKKNTTPAGIYRLKYKQKDATLKGEDYSTQVSFWMPFNGNIGIHDATWRSKFGGNIYMTNGSHGCVNAPYDVAKTIFSNIQPDTPVICYFE
jgi:hypothetical protein